MKQSFLIFFCCFAFLSMESFNSDDTSKVNSLNHLSKQFYPSDMDKSYKYANEALDFSKKINYPLGTAVAQFNIGNILLIKDNAKQGTDKLNESLKLAIENKDKYLMRDCYAALAQGYAKMKNYEKAFESHQKYSEVKDEIFREESNRILEETLEKYEVKQKDSYLRTLHEEISLQQKELRKEKRLKNYSIFSFAAIVVVVGGILLYNYSKSK